MKVEQLHKMRLKEQAARRALARNKNKKLETPLSKEIEQRKEEIIRGLLDLSPQLVNQQLALASLPVTPESQDNNIILKSSGSLLDRVFGKAKETVDFSGNVQFSLRALAQERLKIGNEDITPIEDLIE